MISLIVGTVATSAIAKFVSEYLKDGIENSYQEKRTRIRERLNF